MVAQLNKHFMESMSIIFFFAHKTRCQKQHQLPTLNGERHNSHLI